MKIKYYQMGEFKFTLHDMQYLSLLCNGFVHKEIAVKMNVAKGTVDHAVAHLVHKAHLKNAKELTHFCSTHGLQKGGIFNGKKLFKKPKDSDSK